MMTPRENYEAVLAGKKPDELPVYVANTSAFLRGYYGVTGREMVDDVETHVEVTSKFVKEYDFASVAVVAYIFFGCGPEMGVEWKFSGDDLPGAVAGPLKSEPDLAKLSVPQKPTGYFKRYLEILARLQREMGDRVFFNGSVQGPHTNGCFLRGVETALMDPIDEPDFYQRYMKFCVELSEYFGVHVLGLGLPHNVMLEIFLTPDMIGPDYYYEHVAPYSHEVVDHFAALGKKLPTPWRFLSAVPTSPKAAKPGNSFLITFSGPKVPWK